MRYAKQLSEHLNLAFGSSRIFRSSFDKMSHMELSYCCGVHQSYCDDLFTTL